MWHVSVSFQTREGPRAPGLMTPGHKRVRRQIAEMLLAGVGGDLDYWHGEKAAILHLRRVLTDEEIAGLPDAWCAIPATSIACAPERVVPRS